MNNQSLWGRLEMAELVNGQEPENIEAENTLWYVRVMQGFAGWLSALFLLGFLGFGFAGFFDNGAALLIMGLIINASTIKFFKSKPDSDFFEQLVLVFSLTGQILVAVGLFVLFEFKSHHWLVLIAVYQLILVWAVPHYLHRFLSTWFAIIAAFWGLDFLWYSGLGGAALSVLFVWLWLDKVGWESEKEFYEPVAYAVALALLQFNMPGAYGGLGSVFGLRYGEPSWLMLHGYHIATVLNSAVLFFFIYRVMQEQGVGYQSTTGKLLILAAVLMLFLAMPVIGLSSAVLVLLVGFTRQNKILMVLGVLSLLGFVSWYYYSLNTTLLNKSLILMVMGLVLLVAYFMVRKIYQAKGLAGHKRVNSSNLSLWQKFAAGLTLMMVMVGVNHAISEKESLLEEGQSVFLELAPVDPRSLMQGDYMRLRFDMANKIRNQIQALEIEQQQMNTILKTHNEGFVWVQVDEKGVGRFHSLEETKTKELVKMQYRIRKGRVQFATNAFFFQEGDAKLFDQAKYGEFKVSIDGELLLKAMYDVDLKLLGENRLD